jgi:hypothetical protein
VGQTGSAKGLDLSYPNGFGIGTGSLEGFRSFKIHGYAYVLAGITVGAGLAGGTRCTAAASYEGGTWTCPSGTGRWSGFAGRYGPSGGFVFADKSPTNGYYTLIWLPQLRIEHVFSQIQAQNAACEVAYGKGNCSGWSFGNVVFTGAIAFDFGHAPWGCGLQLGLAALVGELASRDRTWLLGDISFAYSVGF